MRHSRVARLDDREKAVRGRSRVLSAAILEFGFFSFLAGNLFAVPESSGIRDISISKPFFNPTLGQKVEISFSVGRPGSLTLQVLDRDGFLTRKLVSEKPVRKGKLFFEWDGRADRGDIVPDEAYSVKIDLTTGRKINTYFPANAVGQQLPVQPTYYDRRSAIVAYKLPKPSRVHIQAGTARIDPKTREARGPVLKTIVNREPRVGGSIVEPWAGMDESGTIRVPDLPNFVIAIAASALPENSVIAVGNRTARFLDRAAKRTGRSLLTFSVDDHHHHRGLSALDDVSPALRLSPQNAAWSSDQRVWITEAQTIKLSVSLEGPSAASFARQPGRLHVFLDQESVLEVESPKSGLDLEIPLGSLAPGVHILAFNWGSGYGPVAVGSLRVKIGKRDVSSRASKR